MKKFKIEIPNPCHEDWNTMTPEAKGRFCSSCEKIVIDFTGMTSREISQTLKSQKNVCGRINESQLAATYFHIDGLRIHFPFKNLAAGMLLLLAPITTYSQNSSSTTTSVEKREIVESKWVGEIAVIDTPLHIVQIKVIDSNGKVLNNVTVELIDEEGVRLGTMVSNVDGFAKIQFEANNSKKLYLQIAESREYSHTKVMLDDTNLQDEHYVVICERKELDHMIMGKFIMKPN